MGSDGFAKTYADVAFFDIANAQILLSNAYAKIFACLMSKTKPSKNNSQFVFRWLTNEID